MRSKIGKRVALLGIVLLCGGTIANAGPAVTTEDATTKMRIVDYSDLNLANPAAVSLLYARIRRAADLVCDRVSPTDMHLHGIYLKCRDRAVSEAVEKINVPTLSALHRQRASRITSG